MNAIHAIITMYLHLPTYMLHIADGAYTRWVNAMHTDWLWGALVIDAIWCAACLIVAGRQATR